MAITIYHNPRCSKSRACLDLLREHSVEPEVIEYLATPPDHTRLRELVNALGISAHDLVRRGEQAWAESGLGDDASEAQVIAALVAAPILIERPIIVNGERAVIGRPPENVLSLLDD